jgi:hypothetical protein
MKRNLTFNQMNSIHYSNSKLSGFTLIIITILTLSSLSLNAQQGALANLKFGVHADPMIGWFGSDNSTITNKGARPGFNFGVSVYKYFGPNYAFSTGINIISAGGRLLSSDTTIFHLSHSQSLKLVKVNPGEAIVYKIQYLSVPLGLKLQTNQIGYITFFTDLGLDPKVVIAGKADIPSHSIKGENAIEEIRMFNMSYHIIAGIEYGVGGNTAVALGLGFENNFFDITREKGAQPVDKITHKLLSFRLGVNF